MTGPELHFVVPGSLDRRTGGTIYDARMVGGLRRRGWKVVVYELAGESRLGDGPDRVNLAEALARIPDGSRVVIDGLAMSRRPDVVRVHGSRIMMLALVHLLSADDPEMEPSGRDRALELECDVLAACAGVVVTSAFSAARLRDIGVDPAVVRVVRPGSDRVPLAVGPGDAAPPRLLCVAAVTPGKGQDVLVRALKRLADVPWTCICAGTLSRSVAYSDHVRMLVREAGLDDRIAFAGECDEERIDALYRTSSVFVLPSYYEAYGMALTEAMARGLPVVTTTAGAIPDTVPTDGGILVPPGDDAALADALGLLLEDAANERGNARARRAQLGAAARRHAWTLPDWEGAVDLFAEAVSALGSSAARR